MTSTTVLAPSRRQRRTAAMAAAALVGLLAVATACGDNHASGAPQSTTAPPATSAPPATTTPAATTPTTQGGSERAVLDHVLQGHLAAREFVGARIAVRDADGTITETTAGQRAVDDGATGVDPTIAWNIGSATKTFVAVVTLQLADEGRLDLDAPIAPFFPDLPGADRITARQLLQHTSGLNEYLDRPEVANDQTRHWTPAELIAVAEKAGRVGEPGGAHHYANTNYIVLGQIIEQVTGHSWVDEVRSRIALPLGLTHTDIVGGERPPGYKVVDGALVDATNTADPSIGGAAGALASDGHDLLTFVTALAQGKLLSSGSMAAMETFVPGEDYSQFGIDHGYGLGIERYATGTITVIGHMGTGEGHTAYVGYDGEHDRAIAVQTNTAIPGPSAIMAVEALTALAR